MRTEDLFPDDGVSTKDDNPKEREVNRDYRKIEKCMSHRFLQQGEFLQISLNYLGHKGRQQN